MAGVSESWLKITCSSIGEHVAFFLHDVWGYVSKSEVPTSYAGLVDEIASYVGIYMGLVISGCIIFYKPTTVKEGIIDVDALAY